MSLQSQLDQVLALAEKATPGEWMLATSCSWRRIIAERSHAPVIVPTTQRTDNHPDLDCGEDYVNAELAIAAVNFLRQHGPAILAAVGGKAVAWAHPNTLEILDRCRNDEHNGTVEVWMRAHPDIGVTSPLYASPPATVDVGALLELVEKWRNESNVKYPRGTAAREMAPEERYEIEGRCEQLDTCADELAALIGEKA